MVYWRIGYSPVHKTSTVILLNTTFKKSHEIGVFRGIHDMHFYACMLLCIAIACSKHCMDKGCILFKTHQNIARGLCG